MLVIGGIKKNNLKRTNDAHSAKRVPTRSIGKIVDPAAYFSNWFFRIDPHHYETLGLSYKRFMQNRSPYLSWSKMIPTEFRFQKGHVFYAHNDSSHFLQVAADWDSFKIEVHEGRAVEGNLRDAFAINHDDLAVWLQTGQPGVNPIVLDRSTSKAGLLAWRIKQ